MLLLSEFIFSQNTYSRSELLMGSRFDLTVIADNELEGKEYLLLAINEIKRIENLISSWDSKSETSNINQNAGIKPVKVSRELFTLIERSLALSRLTDGAFDISYASMDRIWKFDGSMLQMPTDEQIKASVSKVGNHKVQLDSETLSVFLKEKGMKIGFGAIGKGYAADRAKSILVNRNVQGGIINAGGDMSTWGKQLNGDSWKVAIKNPLNKNRVFALLPSYENAIVTSGDYEKFVEFDGQRYTHIIDPRTGYPSTGLISVTVIAPKAELADALATSIFVMGAEVGLNRVNQMKGVECLIITENGDIHKSNNINLEDYEE